MIDASLYTGPIKDASNVGFVCASTLDSFVLFVAFFLSSMILVRACSHISGRELVHIF